MDLDTVGNSHTVSCIPVQYVMLTNTHSTVLLSSNAYQHPVEAQLMPIFCERKG